MSILKTNVELNIKLNNSTDTMQSFAGDFNTVGESALEYASLNSHDKLEVQLMKPDSLEISEADLITLASGLNLGAVFLAVNLGLTTYSRLEKLGFKLANK